MESTLSLTSQPNYLHSTSSLHPSTSLPGCSSTSTLPSSSTTHSRPLAYTPSPPSLSSSDKIPRRSDPPMKRKSSGNLSPTLRKSKGRLPIPNNLVANSPNHADLSGVLEGFATPMTSS